MFERFTDRARKVMQCANQEAQRIHHEYIGTEHILLGLVKEDPGVADNVLKRRDVDSSKILLEIEKIVQAGPDMIKAGKYPQTPRVKKVIEYAMEEARNLNHKYVGTEHLLLGLVREHESVAAQILINLGLKLEDVLAEVHNVLSQSVEFGEHGKGQPSGLTDATFRQTPNSINSRAFAYMRLLRLPTVFTALADIFLGFLLTHSEFDPRPEFLALCVASVGLYLSGMVFNDYFDRLIDAQERPHRPIPSGQVSPAAAFRLAAVLMLVGLGAAATVGMPSAIVAGGLCFLIVAYDGGLKKTPLGPVVMGSCRFGNVMLGASAVSTLSSLVEWPQLALAAGLGLYIVGVTLFARQEATVSRRSALCCAAAVINAGILSLAYFASQSVLAENRIRALGILAVILVTLDRRLASAITEPDPLRVQLAIKTLLLSLVMLDATLVYAFNGNEMLGMATVALLIPAIGLSRLIAMT